MSQYQGAAGIDVSRHELAIEQNRAATKYTRAEQMLRILWIAGSVVFRFTPRPFFSVRRWILRCFGATIGREVHVYPSTRIYFPWNLEAGDYASIGEWVLVYNLGKVTIGTNASISHQAHICAGSHDYRKADLPLLKPPIVIGDSAWICADAFVGPGVSVAEGAVVGARAVVTRDVAAWTVVAGNPAQFIKNRQVR